MSPEGRFAYSSDEIYCNNKGYVMTGASMKYLCAMLNSRLITFLVRHSAVTTGAGLIQWFKITVEAIPVPDIAPAQQEPFIALVDDILSAKHEDPSAELGTADRAINAMVYQLYGLTDKEIQAVEGNF